MRRSCGFPLLIWFSVVVLAGFLHGGAARRIRVEKRSSRTYSLSGAEALVNKQIHDAMAKAKNSSVHLEPEEHQSNNSFERPIVEISLCVEVDIDLSSQVPGLMLNLGLLGAVEYSFKDGCWGFKFEIQLGVTFGFKIWGYGFKVSLARTGFYHVHEQPVGQVSEQSEIVAEMARYLPDSVDRSQCATLNPFSIIMTSIRHYILSWLGTNEVMQECQQRRQEIQATEAKFAHDYALFEAIYAGAAPSSYTGTKYYPNIGGLYEYVKKDISDGTSLWKLLALAPYLEEQPSTKPLNMTAPLKLSRQASQDSIPSKPAELDPWKSWKIMTKEFKQLQRGAERTFHNKLEFSRPAVAMLKATRAFIEKLPAYATQVMQRLVDNQELIGNDAELVSMVKSHMPIKNWITDLLALPLSKAVQTDNFENMPGRFLARYPDNAYKVASEGEWKGPTQDRDQRVVNIPKVMRLSKYNKQPFFWKEIAISASNLFVRIVGDVKALFAIHFAEDPWWDGSCDSLPIVVDARNMNFQDKNYRTWHDVAFGENASFEQIPYPWSSGAALDRGAFASDGYSMLRSQSLRNVPNLEVIESAPKLIKTSTNDTTPRFKPVLFPHLWCRTAEQARNGSLPRNDYPEHDSELEALVDADAPIKVRVIQACHTVVRKGDGKAMLRRPECEEVDLPVSFVRTFPRFVHLVELYVRRLEVLLLEINLCLDETFVTPLKKRRPEVTRIVLHGSAEERSARQQACAKAKTRKEYVEKKASAAVRLVRMFLLRMGGRVRLEEEAQERKLDLSGDEEKIVAEQAVVNGPIGAIMADDYMHAFGVGKEGYSKDNLEKILRTRQKLQIEEDETQLEGFFWEDAWALGEEILGLAVGSLANRPNRWQDELRPLVEYEYGWKLTATTAKASLCTPPSATLNFERISKTRAKTWTDVFETAVCYWALIKPGSTAIEILSCKNDVTKETVSVVTLKVNLMVLGLGPDTGNGALTGLNTFLGAMGGGLGSFAMSSLNLASMSALGLYLQKQGRKSPAYAKALAWITGISAHAIPAVLSHEATKEGLMSFLSDVGLGQELADTATNPTSGWQPFAYTSVAILSYNKIVVTPAPGQGVPTKTELYAFVWVHEMKMCFSVPGAVDITPYAAVVIVWPTKGSRLPDFDNGDIDID